MNDAPSDSQPNEHARRQLAYYNDALRQEALERYRVEAALRESERRFRAAFDQPAVGMAHLEADGRFLRVNARLCELLALPEDELLSRRVDELAHTEDAVLDRPQRERLLAGHLPHYAVERRFVGGDGRVRRLRQSVASVPGGPEEAAWLMAVFVPVEGDAGGTGAEPGSRQDMECQLAAAREQLEAAQAEIDALSYSVSHDLRAPLRAVSGFSRILERDYADRLDEEARQYLDLVLDGALRLDHLIRDILAYSRLGRHPIERQRVDARRIAEECVHSLRPQCEGRAVDFEVGDLPPCEADPTLLHELFLALLGNAVKFSRGRSPARIEVGGERVEDDTLRYFVRDNGIGFDMRYAHKLFGVFQRLHRADEFEGTGIGLAIAQRIVQRHHGRIWAESVPDQGATFFFTLPAAVLA